MGLGSLVERLVSDMIYLDGATPFGKGVDFALHFQGKKFTIKDIQSRYGITYRHANRLKSQIDRIVGLKPVGFGKRTAETGPEPFLWEIDISR